MDLLDNIKKYLFSDNNQEERVQSSAVKVLLLAMFAILCLALHIIIKRWKSERTLPKDYDFIYNLEDCPICYHPLCEAVRLNCGHVTCLNCLVKFCSYNKDDKLKCSICRQIIYNATHLEGYTELQLPAKEKKKLLAELYSNINPPIEYMFSSNVDKVYLFIIIISFLASGHSLYQLLY